MEHKILILKVVFKVTLFVLFIVTLTNSVQQLMSETTSSTFRYERGGAMYPDFIFCPYRYDNRAFRRALRWKYFNDSLFLDLMGHHDDQHIPDWLEVYAITHDEDDKLY